MRKEIESEIEYWKEEMTKEFYDWRYSKGRIEAYEKCLELLEHEASGKKFIDDNFPIKYKDCEIAIDGKVIGKGDITFNPFEKPVEPYKHKNKTYKGVVNRPEGNPDYYLSQCDDCNEFFISK